MLVLVNLDRSGSSEVYRDLGWPDTETRRMRAELADGDHPGAAGAQAFATAGRRNHRIGGGVTGWRLSPRTLHGFITQRPSATSGQAAERTRRHVNATIMYAQILGLVLGICNRNPHRIPILPVRAAFSRFLPRSPFRT